MNQPSGERPPLRIGTSEREAAYAALNAHLDAGRLDPDEYGERYAKASLARTRADLDALFLDLPAPHPAFGDAAPQPNGPSWSTRAARSPSRGWRLTPALFGLVPLIAIVIAISTGFWFLIFLIPFGASILGRGFGHRDYRRGGLCGPGWGRS